MEPDQFAFARLGPAARDRLGLPDALHPLPLPLAWGAPEEVLLRAYQLCAESFTGWPALEPAWAALVRRLGRARGDLGTAMLLEGPARRLALGPVALDGPLLCLQRGTTVLAAMSREADGSIRLATFRPLDERALGFLDGAGALPDPGHGVAMRANAWEYLQDQAAGLGQAYAADRGDTYLSPWEFGLGLDSARRRVPAFWRQRRLKPRPLAEVVAQLAARDRWPRLPALRVELG
ncbi:hypothetical protein ACI6QG_18755 [Roseococcus sp. DSY-14]|uniref:hypothetical protein n=1 Tax=Roseococcus sp. DSY-14 TaxID=3369650 RepID=UPI00387B0F99